MLHEYYAAKQTGERETANVFRDFEDVLLFLPGLPGVCVGVVAKQSNINTRQASGK